MLGLNQFIINGKSTYDFPFKVWVEENDPPRKPRKKNKKFSNDYGNGSQIQTIDAYDNLEKSYIFYIHDANIKQMREFKSWVDDTGWFTPYDDPELKYKYYSVEYEPEPLDAVNGYQVKLIFDCYPFALEEEKTVLLGDSITNHTNAPMYPLIKIMGSTGHETFLQIGKDKMIFKEIQDVIYIECLHEKLDVWSSGGRKLNGETKGEFFEIKPGKNDVVKGPGISSVEITTRWGWK